MYDGASNELISRIEMSKNPAAQSDSLLCKKKYVTPGFDARAALTMLLPNRPTAPRRSSSATVNFAGVAAA